MKICKTCQQQKPATTEFFYPRKDRPLGITSRCRECTVVAAMAYEKLHPKPKATPKEKPTVRRCARCKEEKPATTEFFLRAGTDKSYLQSYCRPCANDYTVNARRKNPRYREISRRKNLKRNYGISIEEYEQMAKSQNNLCAICGRAPYGKSEKHLHVDHDHKTNKVRGLLCTGCNQGIGKFQDNPESLRKAAEYLENHNLSSR